VCHSLVYSQKESARLAVAIRNQRERERGTIKPLSHFAMSTSSSLSDSSALMRVCVCVCVSIINSRASVLKTLLTTQTRLIAKKRVRDLAVVIENQRKREGERKNTTTPMHHSPMSTGSSSSNSSALITETQKIPPKTSQE